MLRTHRFGFTGLLGLSLAVMLMNAELGTVTNSQAWGGLVLQSNSVSTVTFAVETVNRNQTGLSPVFDQNGVLRYPGSPTYPALGNVVAQQGPVFAGPPPRSRTNNYTQILDTDPTVIDPISAGTGHSSVSLSSSIPNTGSQVGNSGVAFNPGSFVFSSPISRSNIAIVSITTAVAVFTVTSGGPALSLGVYLDAAGFVKGGPGSFVAVGLSGSFSSTADIFTSNPTFQLVGAYAGSGTQIVPTGGDFNTGSNAPPGFDFELIASQILNPGIVLPVNSTIKISTTLTLIADPNSLIELFPVNPNSTVPHPDFGVFAGGVDDIAVPEPSTLIGLLFAAPLAGLLYRRNRQK